jgi:hypothetical protein
MLNISTPHVNLLTLHLRKGRERREEKKGNDSVECSREWVGGKLRLVDGNVNEMSSIIWLCRWFPVALSYGNSHHQFNSICFPS